MTKCLQSTVTSSSSPFENPINHHKREVLGMGVNENVTPVDDAVADLGFSGGGGGGGAP